MYTDWTEERLRKTKNYKMKCITNINNKNWLLSKNNQAFTG